MATQIEDEPLPWYLVNAVVGTETEEIIQYNDLIQTKLKTLDLWQNGLSK